MDPEISTNEPYGQSDVPVFGELEEPVNRVAAAGGDETEDEDADDNQAPTTTPGTDGRKLTLKLTDDQALKLLICAKQKFLFLKGTGRSDYKSTILRNIAKLFNRYYKLEPKSGITTARLREFYAKQIAKGEEVSKRPRSEFESGQTINGYNKLEDYQRTTFNYATTRDAKINAIEEVLDGNGQARIGAIADEGQSDFLSRFVSHLDKNNPSNQPNGRNTYRIQVTINPVALEDDEQDSLVNRNVVAAGSNGAANTGTAKRQKVTVEDVEESFTEESAKLDENLEKAIEQHKAAEDLLMDLQAKYGLVDDADHDEYD